MTFLLASVLEPRANREGEGSEIPEHLWALPNFSPLFLGSGVVDLWLKGPNMEPVCLALLFIRNDACMSPSPPPPLAHPLLPISYSTQESQDTHSPPPPLTFHLPALTGMKPAFAPSSHCLQHPSLAPHLVTSSSSSAAS